MKANYVVFGGDNYNTLGIIRTLGEAKLEFETIIVKSHFILASKSKYINELHMVNTIEEGYELLLKNVKHDYEKHEKRVLLIEGDTLTAYLDNCYSVLSQYYIYNQAAGNIAKYENKHEQVKLAEECGLDIMKTWTVRVGEIPEDITYPVITKATSSLLENWKSEVHICNDENELTDAFTKLRSKTIILQQFIQKDNEYVLDGYSINRGRDQCITIASTYNYIIPGEYAYSMIARNFKDDELQSKITMMMEKIGYEGIYEFELLHGVDGKFYFLEVNLRNSGWSYASTVAGMPLPILWAKSMINKNIDPSDIKPIKDEFVFIDDINDFKARVVGKRISFIKWVKEYSEADCKLTLGRNDLKPMIVHVAKRFIDKAKRTLTH